MNFDKKNLVYNLRVNTKAVPLHSQYRGVEQLVARWAHNPKVIRSSRVSATKERA